MARFRIAMIGFVVGGFLVMTSGAWAVTLGTTTLPSGSAPGSCAAGVFYTQGATDSSYHYAVPAGGGVITSWSTNTSGDSPGTSLTLLVLRPSGTTYTVVGSDTETLPTPLPASNLATFSLAHPIATVSGDVIGFDVTAGFDCAFTGGTIPAAEVITAGVASSPPTPGTVYTALGPQASSLIDLSANLDQSDDVGVTGVAAPSSIPAGGGAEYAFVVSSSGPGSAPITFTDTVRAGLKILSAVAGTGICSTTGQTVTCTIPALAPGSTAPVSVVVSAPRAGSYPDTAAVATPLTDPALANNSTSATLRVTAAAPPSCKVVKLAGTPLAAAKVVIRALNCKVGKTTKKTSKRVRKGNVISTRPGSGKHPAGTKVNIVVSSGPAAKKK